MIHRPFRLIITFTGWIILLSTGCRETGKPDELTGIPDFKLIPSDTFRFNSFVDCNMAEAWVGDTFRIFPGKYGEDPLWGNARDLKYADGRNADEAFAS
jgi:hypothetical protein